MNLYDYFETKTRPADGETFVTLKDDRPDWLYDAVMEAHDGEFPDDWRYRICRSICGAIDDNELTDEDGVAELADSLVDVWTAQRLRWLADSLSRTQYVDDARDGGLMANDADIADQIGVGQYVCIERMAHVILAAWHEVMA